MSEYKIVSHPAEGLIETEHSDYGRQIWSECRMTFKHKKDACVICRRMVGPVAYRPVTNRSNRMMRMCRGH